MKKKAVILFMVFCALAVFAKGGDAGGGPITLTYWTHEDPNRTKIEDRYIDEFQAANPNITVERVTNASGKIAEIILTAFAANQGPHVFNIGIEEEYAYVANARVAPVDLKACGYSSLRKLRDNYLEGVLDPVTFDGKVYGLPLELTNWCIYVNDRVFKSAGLDPDKDYPKTWEDMVAISEKIVIREGEIITRRGFDFRYSYYLISLVPMVEQLGGKLISDDGKTAIINDEAWLTFLNFMKEWGPNGKNLGSPTYKNSRKLFNQDNNDVAMCISGLYQEGRIRNDNPEFFNSGEWRVIPYPQFENAVNEVAACYYGHYFMVNIQKPENEQTASWQLISYMLQHPEEYLETVGLIQATRTLMDSDIYKNMPYSKVFADDMEKGHVVYYAENSTKMNDLLKEAVESVMLSGVAPEKALATLKTKAQEILQ
jgi:multiple sugar transport system substrate-binding protein